MFSSKSVRKDIGESEAKSYLSEEGIVFDSEERSYSADRLSRAHKESVAYTSFLGTVFHKERQEEDLEKAAEEQNADSSLPVNDKDKECLDKEHGAFNEESAVRPSLNERAPGLGTLGYSNGIAQQSIERAEKLLEQSRIEAERIREEARAEGFRQGVMEGRESGYQQISEELRQQWSEELDSFYKDCALALGNIEELKRRRLSRYLDELKDISIAVAEKVIHVSLKSSGEVIRKMILNEAEKLRKTSWLKIYIDKAEYEMLLETDSAIATELSGVSRNIRFVISEKSDIGKLIMETPDEIVDLSIGTQMENLRTGLSQLEPREEQENTD